MRVALGNERYPRLENPEAILGRAVSSSEWDAMLRDVFGDGICVLKTWNARHIASTAEQELALQRIREHLDLESCSDA